MRRSNQSAAAWPATYLWVFGIAGYPLVSFVAASLDKAPSGWVTVGFRAAYLGLAVWLIWRAWQVGGMPGVTARDVPWMIFWGLYVARLIFDTFVRGDRLRLPIHEYYLYTFGITLIPMIAFRTCFTKSQLNRARRWLTCALGVVSVWGSFNNLNNIGTDFIRVYGNEYLNPITFGHIGVLLVGLSLYTVLLQENRRPLSVALHACIGLPLGLLAVAMAGSRGPVIALVAVVSFILLNLIVRARVWAVTAAILVLLIATPFLIRIATSLGSGAWGRVVETADTLDSGGDVRLDYWSEGWQEFSNFPIFGSSLELARSRRYPHNVVIEGFMATGALGGVSLVLCILIALARLGLSIVRRSSNGWLGIILVQSVVAAMFSGSVYSNSTMWYLVAMVTAMPIGLSLRRKAPGRQRVSMSSSAHG